MAVMMVLRRNCWGRATYALCPSVSFCEGRKFDGRRLRRAARVLPFNRINILMAVSRDHIG